MKFVLTLLAVFCLSQTTAIAQEAPSDLQEKVTLAKEMHKLRPVKPQVDRAIEKVTAVLPEDRRENFKLTMQRLLNYDAIETLSIEIMAETYTKEELEVMVAYYSQPLALSAADKTATYQEKLGPEIIRILDRAMMELRTGGTGP